LVGVCHGDDFRVGLPITCLALVRAIRDALEAGGVEFIDENGGGPGVRLRKRSGTNK
jgi:hypothetical protein